jgi:hypothetical protein
MSAKVQKTAGMCIHAGGERFQGIIYITYFLSEIYHPGILHTNTTNFNSKMPYMYNSM